MQENRARREVDRQRQQRERESQLGAREEEKKRQREEEARKKQEARRQEELVQQEMVRLRRQIEERRAVEQLVRKRYGLPESTLTMPLYQKLPYTSCQITLYVTLPASYRGWNRLMTVVDEQTS